MRTNALLLVVGGAALMAGAWFFTAGGGRAADEDDQKIVETIKAMAKDIQKNGLEAGRAHVNKLGQADPDDIMPLFSQRNANGKGIALGIGPTPGAITPDGIEKKLEELAKKPLSAKEVERQGPALEEAGYISAAIAEAVEDHAPAAKVGQKQQWTALSRDMAKLGVDFAKAVQTRDPGRIHQAADKLDASCKACHKVFKD